MPKEAEEKKKQDIWEVKLALIDDTQPPRKLITSNETDDQLDVYEALARILNNQEAILKGLL